MLNNIRLHVEKDEEQQALLESKLAEHITRTQKDNINCFQRQIPSLVPYITTPAFKNYSVFCNKFGEFNIVDYSIGRTIYGIHPEQEIETQCRRFLSHSQYISIEDSSISSDSEKESPNKEFEYLKDIPAFKNFQASSGLPEEVECIVVLGCGLGLQIQQLLQHSTIKHLIIYEPEPQYFQCSSLVTSWRSILELAKSKGTSLYFQLEKDGRNLISDLEELKELAGVKGFFLYQHYNHPIFASLYEQLSTQSWDKLVKYGLNFQFSENYLDYCPVWTPPSLLDKCKDLEKSDNLFQRNLTALKKYYPDIHEQFQYYIPKKWQPFRTVDDKINLLKHSNLVTWYSDYPQKDCLKNFDGFSEQPNKDGLVLGYDGKKLAHYLHYKFVKKTEKLIQELEEEEGALPEHIQSIIIFGVGAGYQLEKLREKHSFEHLFICEPNPDFFYASLFAIDWQQLFEKVEAQEARLYLNIGDDGTNLFRDLINQFYAIGPYILSNTYFYQSYYNASLNLAIAQLREKLRIVISMGEYFDHAYYGIGHTKAVLANNAPVLSSHAQQKLSFENKQVPVFLIGNGPSIDHSIDTIKEWKNNAIIVSCGTSLKVLHKNGIKPDFHAEIEQNRTTYDWGSLVNDRDYLKDIELISCNGVHPDTCGLYKKTYVAFKEGESSTVSTLSVLDESQYGILNYAFPTVSNFACNLFSIMGFESIYLLGIDLGFIDQKHHHSIHSKYYKEDGEELYDYAERHNTSQVVKGNFRKTVNTKHEFNVSRQVIEDTIRQAQTTTIYNCSDGAKIEGSQPLPLDNILIVTSEDAKKESLFQIKNSAFTALDGQKYLSDFEGTFNNSVLINQLSVFEKLINQEIESFHAAEELIKKQKELLFYSYKKGDSLLFYYFYGTINYTNSVFSKILYASLDHEEVPESFIDALEMWRKAFGEIKNLILSESTYFDASHFLISERETTLTSPLVEGKTLQVFTNSQVFADCVNCQVDFMQWKVDASVAPLSNRQHETSHADYVIYHAKSDFDADSFVEHLQSGASLPHQGQSQTVIVIDSDQTLNVREVAKHYKDVVFVLMDLTANHACQEMWRVDELYSTLMAFKALISGHGCQLLLPKYQVCESYQDNESQPDKLFTLSEEDLVYDFYWYLAVSFDGENTQESVSNIGTRASYVRNRISIENRIFEVLNKDDYQNMMNVLPDFVPNIYHDHEFK